MGEDGELDVDAFRYGCRLTITAQEILVDNASYPTPKIEENSHRFRPLGLGYANLGALLMSRGLAYDSPDGQAYAAAITSIMTAEAYRQSAVIARDHGGPFIEFEKNRAPFLAVIEKHRDAATHIPARGRARPASATTARDLWDETYALGEQHGYRNAQTSLLAPTGTISFMLDCDTTGIEPDIALIKYKKLVGEGYLKIVNNTVPGALRQLGYTPTQVEEIVAFVDERETIEGAPGLKPEHLSVFDCAFKPRNGVRSIVPMGHVRMMAAVQPFLSGAISKTVNMPEAATVEEIEQIYLEGWKLGLKAIAIYRDNSKRSQPLSTTKLKSDDETKAAGEVVAELRRQLAAAQAEAVKPHRRRLPAERAAVTHKFEIAGHEGYITVGLYPDGQPGEIFLKMAKEGSTVSGLMDTYATAISLALQYGVPLRDLVNKFAHVRFEPCRLHRQQRDPDREVQRGLHLPLAREPLPGRRRPGGARDPGSRRVRGGLALLVRRRGARAAAGGGPVGDRRGEGAAEGDGHGGRDGDGPGLEPAAGAASGGRRQRHEGWTSRSSSRRRTATPTATATGTATATRRAPRRRPWPPRSAPSAPPSRSRRTPPPAPTAARSWSATAAATSASTAAPRAAAAEHYPASHEPRPGREARPHVCPRRAPSGHRPEHQPHDQPPGIRGSAPLPLQVPQVDEPGCPPFGRWIRARRERNGRIHGSRSGPVGLRSASGRPRGCPLIVALIRRRGLGRSVASGSHVASGGHVASRWCPHAPARPLALRACPSSSLTLASRSSIRPSAPPAGPKG